MAVVRKASTCTATVTLTEAARRFLYTVPGPAHEVAWQHQCELEAGSHSQHYSLAQSDNYERNHWVRWEDDQLGQYEVVILEPCPYWATSDDPCLLFADHPGAHSDDLAATTETHSGPQPDPDRGHADYVSHRLAALRHLDSASDPAQVHASLAIAAALNRLADQQQG